jgi:hypothetical protein
LSHRARSALADFTLRLSSCRFHERNFKPDREQQKALENGCIFKGFVWLRGQDLNL